MVGGVGMEAGFGDGAFGPPRGSFYGPMITSLGRRCETNAASVLLGRVCGHERFRNPSPFDGLGCANRQRARQRTGRGFSGGRMAGGRIMGQGKEAATVPRVSEGDAVRGLILRDEALYVRTMEYHDTPSRLKGRRYGSVYSSGVTASSRGWRKQRGLRGG